MNFSKSYTPEELVQAMPADLRALYLANNPREYQFDKYTFRDFIDESFEWSQTPQGHNFWSIVSELCTFENWEACMPLRGIDHLRAMPEALRLMFLEEIGIRQNIPLADLRENWESDRNGIATKSSNWFTYIGEFFIFDSSIYGEVFWRAIRNTNNTKALQKIVDDYNRPVTLINGETAPRKDCALLYGLKYGANAYALRSEAKYVGDNWILIEDLATFYDSDNRKREALKSKLEKNSDYILIGENFVNVLVAHRHGKGRNMAGIWQDIDQVSYAVIGTNLRFEKIADLPPNYVFVNSYREGYKRYFGNEHSNVYKCDHSGLYYNELESPYASYTLVTANGDTRTIKISSDNQILPSWRLEGQRLQSVRYENENGRMTTYFSLESAIYAGLEISHCPHCNQSVSQYHDRDYCKRDNFRNERFSYHSKKPRYISSRSEFKIGVEIEKESFDGASHSCHDINRFKGWVKESDGSLDGRIGYELVSPAFGLFGNNLIKEAEELEAKFPSLINGETSSACGGHIHFSRANTSGADTLEMYCGYLPLLYAIYKGRTKANYCKGIEKDEMKYSRDKYQAVRVLDNRIEFRIFPAVKNLKTLIWRVQLLRYIAKNPTASPVKVVNDLCDKRTGLHKLFLEIFSESTIYKRAQDTLTMAQKYDRNYYNIDFTAQRKAIEKKAVKAEKK